MNIIRYIRTVRYLKPEQIFYQLKYRICGYKYPARVKKVPETEPRFSIVCEELDRDEQYVERFNPQAILNNEIIMLNESIWWESGSWNIPDRTHLWNFNLHYFEYAIAMATEYNKSKDEQYYSKFKELYEDWHTNAYEGRNTDAWHPYTVSLRIRNLLISTEIFGDVIKQDSVYTTILEDIYNQYRFLHCNHERHLQGNHYFENIVTLFLCSLVFNESQKSEQYANQLISEMNEQILPDGMHYERSFMYHNLILEDLIRCKKAIATVSYSNTQLVETIDANIKKMTDCVYSFEYNKQNHIPAFNDAGSNVAKSCNQLVSAVKSIYEYKPHKVDSLPNAGYYRIENEQMAVIMDIGDIAPSYISGHGHCDALSIEVYYKDEPILVNSGTYNYQTEKRTYFRSTRAHNTLCAKNNEQSECWGEHRTARRITNIKYHEKSQLESQAKIIEGKVTDYQGNELSRELRVNDASIVIADTCSVPFESYWHIHPDNRVNVLNEQKLEIITPNGQSAVVTAQGKVFNVLNSYYSEEFGKIVCTKSYCTSASKVIIST